MQLTQFTGVGNPLARAIECLEATSANPADVYLYWLAILAGTKEALERSYLPDEVCGQIRGILNSRWKEFFVDGPTNAHLSAFYLNPGKYHSSVNIFHSSRFCRLRAIINLQQAQPVILQHHPS